MSRRPISVGIQPQIALYSVILGSVCAFGWYTEKYRRDEGELDEQIQKMYLRNAQEAQSKMPQMTATIKGQSMDLDGRMDKLVWGGKAQLKSGGNNSALAAMAEESSNGDSDDSTVASSEEKKTRKKTKKAETKETIRREIEKQGIDGTAAKEFGTKVVYCRCCGRGCSSGCCFGIDGWR